MIIHSFREANRWTLKVWYDRWFLWLSLFLLVEIFNQILNSLLDGFEASQVGYFLASITWSAVDFTLAVMLPPVLIALQKNERAQIGPHMKKYFDQACIESVRGTAKVLWFSYLLLIPGFIKMLQLVFVPYVVQFDTLYDAGKRDALKESAKLSKGHLGSIFVVFTACSILTLVEGIKSSFTWDSPFFALAFLLTLVVRLYTQIVWFSMYKVLSQRSSL